jgi:serine/threonine protein kinase
MEKLTKEEFFKRFKYKATDKIGGGSFGQVYKAEDDVLNKTVAVKVSAVQIIERKQFSLLDEFEALKNVKAHRNIANYEELHTFEMHNGIYDFAIMQYYPDGNLGEYLKKNIAIEVKEQIAIDLLKGIVHLHQNKVVHRDLKPSNILIVIKNKEVIPKITDFGLSKKASLDHQTRFDNSFGGGTLAYSSPEQLKGEELRLNTDLWAYGVIVYEIFTQKPLFYAKNSSSANSNGEIYDQVNSKELSKEILKLPLKWQKVVAECLVRDATKRTKNATSILELVTKNITHTKEKRITKLPTSSSNLNSDDDLEGTILKDAPVNEEEKEEGFDSEHDSEDTILRDEPVKVKEEEDSDNRKKNKFIYWALGITSTFLVCYFLIVPLFNHQSIENDEKVKTEQVVKSTTNEWKSKFQNAFKKIKASENNLNLPVSINKYKNLLASLPNEAKTEKTILNNRIDSLKKEHKNIENRKAIEQAKLLKAKKEADRIAKEKRIEDERKSKKEYEKKLNIAKKLISFSGTVEDCKNNDACRVNVTKKLNEALKIYQKGTEAKSLLNQLK